MDRNTSESSKEDTNNNPLTFEEFMKKLSKIQQNKIWTGQPELVFRVERVRVLKWSQKTIQGFLAPVRDKNNAVAQQPSPRHIFFHRDDFRNRLWMLDLIFRAKFEFQVVTVNSGERSRLFLTDRSQFNALKQNLKKLGIDRDSQVQILKVVQHDEDLSQQDSDLSVSVQSITQLQHNVKSTTV